MTDLKLPALLINSLAISPTDGNTLFVGTGSTYVSGRYSAWRRCKTERLTVRRAAEEDRSRCGLTRTGTRPERELE